jgi:NAD-dependent dihydropyrimidine dehydrogenase PreA subunit
MPQTVNEECKQDAGVFVPVIDRNRCEGKEDCVAACPYSVFVIRTLTADEKAGLNPFARFKVFVHGNRQAFAVKAEDCRACGKCVSACPEKAITLRRA